MANPLGNSGDLKGVVSKNTRLIRWSAGAIVAGLIGEVLVLLWFSAEKSLVETTLLIATNLTIAAGVLGEDYFAHKVGEAASELQGISDEKIAAAEVQAAEANARAVEAALQLEKLRAQLGPRVIERDGFLSVLKGKPAPLQVTMSYPRGTGDCWHVALQLEQLLRDVGWNVQPGPRETDPNDPRFSRGAAVSTQGPSSGIRIRLPFASSPQDHEQALALSNALSACLGAISGGEAADVPVGTLEVVIFPRP